MVSIDRGNLGPRCDDRIADKKQDSDRNMENAEKDGDKTTQRTTKNIQKYTLDQPSDRYKGENRKTISSMVPIHPSKRHGGACRTHPEALYQIYW